MCQIMYNIDGKIINNNKKKNISKPGLNLQISHPPKMAQNWFCIQNLHMVPSFQKKKTI